MSKTFVAGKIHGICVTKKSVDYNGSVSICPSLMKSAGINAFEQVHVINLNNGNRWVTYALPADHFEEFSLNGGGARLGELGDKCVILIYEQRERYESGPPAAVIFVDSSNVMSPAGKQWYFGDPGDGV